MDKLKDLLLKRGHGVEHLGIWQKIEEAIVSPILEVYQCECGELMYFNKFHIRKEAKKGGKIVCKICGGYEKQITPMKTEKTIDTLMDLYKKYFEIEKSEQNDIWLEIKSKSHGVFPTRSFEEFQFSISYHQIITSEPSMERLFWTLTFNELADLAKSKDLENLKELFTIADIISANTKLESFYIAFEDLRKTKESHALNTILGPDHKLIGSTSNTHPQEIEIRKEMTIYRMLLENVFPLEILINLALLIRGQKPWKKPFNHLKLKGKKRKPKGIFDKILLLQDVKELNKVSTIIRDLYNTHLRNDDAHVQFIVDIENEMVISTKYKEKRTFTEVRNLLYSLKDFIEGVLDGYNLYPWRLKENWETAGIEDLKFYFDDEIPETSIEIFQYYYFNPKFKTKPPMFNVTFENDKFNLTWGRLNITHDCDRGSKLWFTASAVFKSFVIRIFSIAPDLGYYQSSDSKMVKLNGKNFVILAEKEIKMKLNENFVNFVKNKFR